MMTPERLLSYVLAIGFLVAPAIAMLYGATPGLFVLAGALAATLAIAWPARDSVPAAVRPRLIGLAVLNGVLLVATVIALAVVTL
jgi:hypothetical protein